MDEFSYAPWSPKVVEALNKFQTSKTFDPVVCPEDGSLLVATEEGWICEKCDYTQDWAQRFMIRLGRF